MPNKPLTTSQKLAILEQAIRKGAHIDITFHLGYSDDKTDVNGAYEVFDDMTVSHVTAQGLEWLKFTVGDNDRFEGTIFPPDDYELSKEWTDSGDVEDEANGILETQ